LAQAHTFAGELAWTGEATDAAGRVKLGRAFVVRFAGKPEIAGSSPAVFNGDDARHNPETLMVASLMACHHLTYVALCERAGIVLRSYEDAGSGTLAMKDGRIRMTEVALQPRVHIADAARVDEARALHEKAHAQCFMSNSVNFEVRVQPTVTA
jgi:organic hydroperoxide reductase OsmC/OhrA